MNVSSLGISASLSCAEALRLFSPRVSYPWTAHLIQQIPTMKGVTLNPTQTPKGSPLPRVTRLFHSSPPLGRQALPGSDTTMDIFLIQTASSPTVFKEHECVVISHPWECPVIPSTQVSKYWPFPIEWQRHRNVIPLLKTPAH